MKLFYAPPSPFARKAQIVVRELGLSSLIEETAVNPFTDDARLLDANPAGLVPALVTDSGATLIDSPLICHYLADTAPPNDILPRTGEDRWQVLNTEALADALMDFAVAAMAERRHTDAAPSAAFVQRKMDKIERCLAHFPEQTEPVEGTPHLGQIAMACALAYLNFRYPDFDWRARRPDLASWHATIETRPAFKDTQPAEHLG